MPKFSPGDPVRVQFDRTGTIERDTVLYADDLEIVSVHFDGEPHYRTHAVETKFISLLPRPPRKGDVITEDTPCPEPGTVLLSEKGHARIWGSYNADSADNWTQFVRWSWVGAKVVAVGVDLD